jgi:hypothetical protein
VEFRRDDKLLELYGMDSGDGMSGERGFNDDGDAAILSDDNNDSDGGAMETDRTQPFCDCPDADCALPTLD